MPLDPEKFMESLSTRCIEVILKNEGGYVNDPDDPGGETKFGIAKRFFPNEDIRNLTRQRAIYLYRRHYWSPMNLEGINSEPLVLQVFDCGVNCGTQRAIRMLQDILNVEKDGVCGPITKGHANSFQSVTKIEQNGTRVTYSLLDFYKEARKAYYIDLANRKPVLDKFLKGWLNRIEKTHF